MIVTAKRMQWPFRFCSEILHLHLEIIHRFDPFFFFCGLCTSSVFPLWCTQQQQQRLGEQQQHVSTRRTSISAFSITLHISTHAQNKNGGLAHAEALRGKSTAAAKAPNVEQEGVAVGRTRPSAILLR
jgi:hypothetical protein